MPGHLPSTHRRGVTLVDLVVTVLAIGVLAAAALPRFVHVLDDYRAETCSHGPITLWSSSTETTNQTIHSNSSVTKNSGTMVYSDVDAVGSITGSGTITGTATTPVPPRTVPGSTVFDYYVANGTAISLSSIPKIQGKRTIMDVVLSSGNNPYGATDPAGIYVIDCAGDAIVIKTARIIATLVLINPSTNSIIAGELSWEPAVANYPALLAQTSRLDFAVKDLPLNEADRGVNFNSPGSPYQGMTDTDQNDSYPSLIKGIVYVSGDAVVTNDHPHFDGVLISGDELKVDSGHLLTITYDPLYLSNPPPGFSENTGLVAAPGTWLWDSAP